MQNSSVHRMKLMLTAYLKASTMYITKGNNGFKLQICLDTPYVEKPEERIDLGNAFLNKNG